MGVGFWVFLVDFYFLNERNGEKKIVGQIPIIGQYSAHVLLFVIVPANMLKSHRFFTDSSKFSGYVSRWIAKLELETA